MQDKWTVLYTLRVVLDAGQVDRPIDLKSGFRCRTSGQSYRP